MPVIRPVILSGGSGTRLWPLSTKTAPKQFARLMGDGSLFEQTLIRLAGRPDVAHPVVVTGANHLELVESATDSVGVRPELTIVEPVGRNTAPAVVAAALCVDEDDVLVVLPSDHIIADVDGFAAAVSLATSQAENGRIVTFGIVPSRAETGFGYIEAGPSTHGVSSVVRFKEKPDLIEAERMAFDGRHSWNSGMFVFQAKTLLAEARVHCPKIVEGVGASLSDPKESRVRLAESFERVEKISIDNAIMERTDRAVVIPIDVGWNDVGSFAALWDVSTKDQGGNVVVGDVVAHNVTGSIILATSRTVAVAEMDDVVVVETPDQILIVPLEKSQAVRDLAESVDPAE